MSGASLGLTAKLYRNTGSYASPVWNEVTNVRDLASNLTKGRADVSVRGSTWKLEKATLKEASIEFEMIHDPADADYQAFRDAYMNDTPIEVLVLSGDIGTSGNEGLRAICDVFDFARNEPLTDVLKVSVTLAPTYDTTNYPSWYTVP